MNFLDKVSRGLKRAVDEEWLVVRERAKIAEEKTKGVAKTGELKYQLYTLQRRAEKSMTCQPPPLRIPSRSRISSI
jgi:hypothetical protein